MSKKPRWWKKKYVLANRFLRWNALFTILFAVVAIGRLSVELIGYREGIYNRGVARGIQTIVLIIDETLENFREDLTLLGRNPVFRNPGEGTGKEELLGVLSAYTEVRHQADRLIFMAADGHYASSGGERSPSREKDWYRQALEKNRLVLNGIDVSPKDESVRIVLSLPVLSGGELRGVISCEYSFEILRRLALDFDLSAQAEFGIVVNDHVLIFTGGEDPEEPRLEYSPRDRGTHGWLTLDPGAETAVRIADGIDEKWIVKAVYIPSLEGILYFRTLRKDIDKDISRFVWLVSLIALGLIGITSLFVSLSTVFFVIRPLNTFRNLFDQILSNPDFTFSESYMEREDEIGRMLVSFRDTVYELNRKKAELSEKWEETASEVRSFENLLMTIMESTNEGILYVDREGKISYANRAVETLLAYEGRELIYNSASSLFCGRESEHFDRERCPVFRAFAYGEAKSFYEDQIRRKDGGILQIMCNINPTYKDGSLTGAVIIFHDNQARKEMERSLKEAKESAMELAKAKSGFIERISHEIRTPLNIIIGMSELLGDTELTVSQNHYLDRIRHSSSELFEMMRTVLNFSNLAEDKILIRNEYFDPLAFLHDLEDAYRKRGGKRTGNLSVKLRNGSPGGLISGDPQLLGDVLRNLSLFFEEQHARKSKLTWDVGISPVSGSKAELRFRVSDKYVRLNKSELSAIFHFFEYGDPLPETLASAFYLQYAKGLLNAMESRPFIAQTAGEGTGISFSILFAYRESDEFKVGKFVSPWKGGTNEADRAVDALPSNPDDLLALLEKIEAYLKENDTAVMEYVDALSEKTRGTAFAQDAQGLIELIQEYDFEGATELISGLYGKIGKL